MVVNTYSTLVEAINALREKGFTLDFKPVKEGLESLQNNKVFSPETLKIVEFHRFEGESSVDDMSIVYAIEAKSGERGTIVDAFGTYADDYLSQHLQKMEWESK